MLKSFQNSFKIPELRRRILFTLGIFVVYRIGAYIPIPGIDIDAIAAYWQTAQQGLFGLYDMFVGGAFTKATIFALGIMPNISASIILQLLGSVVPYFQKLQKEGGEEGRRKINQYTRYGTLILAVLQSIGIAYFWEGLSSPEGVPVVVSPGWGFRLLTMLSITTGTVFIMWLGEQITDRGIGNGMSMLIFIGIIAEFPEAVRREYQHMVTNDKGPLSELLIVALMVGVVALVVWITQGQRKISVQYAKRVVGRKVYGGQSTHIPLRVNAPGVIPIIFAQAIMFLPQTVGTFLQGGAGEEGGIGGVINFLFSSDKPVYWIFYSLMIIFFSYFYTAIIINPVDVADNMKKYGGFIPGIRPGRRTSDYIDRILTRITLPGSVFLAAIAIFPFIVTRWMDVSPAFAHFFGGTGLLIVVGVALDTLQNVESHLLVRHYDGFMRKGRIRGRRG